MSQHQLDDFFRVAVRLLCLGEIAGSRFDFGLNSEMMGNLVKLPKLLMSGNASFRAVGSLSQIADLPIQGGQLSVSICNSSVVTDGCRQASRSFKYLNRFFNLVLICVEPTGLHEQIGLIAHEIAADRIVLCTPNQRTRFGIPTELAQRLNLAEICHLRDGYTIRIVFGNADSLVQGPQGLCRVVLLHHPDSEKSQIPALRGGITAQD